MAIIQLIVGLALLASVLVYCSIDRETTVKKILTVFLFALLPLAYFVYPDYIMNRSLASVTIGEIVRLFISVILVLCFIAGEIYLIFSIRNY